MIKSGSRLGKIGAKLAAKPAVIAWLLDAQQHPTFIDYVAAMSEQTEGAFPLHAIPRQLEAAIRAAHPRLSDELIAEASYPHRRDAGFLVDLAIEVNRRIISDEAAHWALLAFLVEQQRPALQGWEAWDGPRAERWAGQLASLAIQILSQSVAVKLIADRYFDGHDPLFPATAQDLTEQCAGVDDVINLFIDALPLQVFGPWEEGSGEGLQIDPAQITVQARQQAIPQAELLVALARSEGLALVGERHRAFGLLRAYMAPLSGA